MRKISIIVVALLLLLMAACSSGDFAPELPAAQAPAAVDSDLGRVRMGVASYSFGGGAMVDADVMAEALEVLSQEGGDFSYSGTGDISTIQRMVIRSADMGIGTYNFDETFAGIEEIMANRGGFIESSNQWLTRGSQRTSDGDEHLLWRGEFVLRVPVGLFDTVNRELMALAQVRYFSTASQDVTMEFQDLASRLRIREEEKRRVEAMLEAAENMRDILNLEAQLTTLRLAIDAYSRRLTEIDQLASFSTIAIMVYELVEYEDDYYLAAYDDTDSFGTRIGNAFSASIDFSVLVLTSIVTFLAFAGVPVAVFGGTGYVIYRVIKKMGIVKRVADTLRG